MALQLGEFPAADPKAGRPRRRRRHPRRFGRRGDAVVDLQPFDGVDQGGHDGCGRQWRRHRPGSDHAADRSQRHPVVVHVDVRRVQRPPDDCRQSQQRPFDLELSRLRLQRAGERQCGERHVDRRNRESGLAWQSRRWRDPNPAQRTDRQMVPRNGPAELLRRHVAIRRHAVHHHLLQSRQRSVGPSGPSINDIQQGYLGDCYFEASCAEVAAENSSDIQAMFSNNGNGTYGVRFYYDGAPEYVTVNLSLADSERNSTRRQTFGRAWRKARAIPGRQSRHRQRLYNYGNSWSTIGNGGDEIYALEA